MNLKTLHGGPVMLAGNHIDPFSVGAWRAFLCLMVLAVVLFWPEAMANKAFDLPGGDLELPGVAKEAKWYTKVIYGIVLVVVLLFLTLFVIGLAGAVQSLFSSANDMRTNGNEKQGEAIKQVGIIIFCVIMSFVCMYLGWEYGIKPLRGIADS